MMHQEIANMTKIKLDFTDPEFIANPYPTYEQLQKHEPVYSDEDTIFYLTRFQDIVGLLNSKHTSRRPPHHITPLTAQAIRENDMDSFMMNWLIFQDPPTHTQMRHFFARAINPNFIRSRSQVMTQFAQHLIAGLKTRDHFDVVNDYATPLSLAVVCELSGLPAQENAFIKAYSDAITQHLDTGDPGYVYGFNAQLPRLRAFFQEYIDYNNQHPTDNFLTHVIHNNKLLDEPLNDTQLADATAFIVFSAHETTRLAISLSIKSLLEHPDQLTLLQQNTDLFPAALEECLRLEPPFTKLSRWTTDTLLVGETEIPKNSLVVALINAANHDSHIFKDPHQLNIFRKPVQNLAFGKGIHTCLGSLLGRLETEIALREFFAHFSSHNVDIKQACWGHITALRYLTQLHVYHLPP